MIFFIIKITKKKVLVRVSIYEKDIIGDVFSEVLPGEFFGKFSFDALVDLGIGEHQY